MTHWPVTITMHDQTWTETVDAPTRADARGRAAYLYQGATRIDVAEQPTATRIVHTEPDAPEPTIDQVLARTAWDAVNAHPDLHIGRHGDETDCSWANRTPGGDYIEGRITWQAAGGRFAWTITIALEPADGGFTVEDETTAVVDPLAPLAWLDLARVVAELMGRLHTEASASA
ncbi:MULTISPECIES: hypothetical protein [unclassified Nocardiopsis]|uniref:hypothetical protein n=1 Tax=Nocardiopsis TaxID=2013 RepID=UPI00387B4D59